MLHKEAQVAPAQDWVKMYNVAFFTKIVVDQDMIA